MTSVSAPVSSATAFPTDCGASVTRVHKLVQCCNFGERAKILGEMGANRVFTLVDFLTKFNAPLVKDACASYQSERQWTLLSTRQWKTSRAPLATSQFWLGERIYATLCALSGQTIREKRWLSILSFTPRCILRKLRKIMGWKMTPMETHIIAYNLPRVRYGPSVRVVSIQ